MTALGDAIGEGVTAVVERYFDDRRIRSRLPLTKRVSRSLKRLNDHPYRTGLLRPDFLHDRAGVPKVCEINARFVFNGLILSVFANRAFGGLFPECGRLAGLDALAATLDPMADEPVTVVKGREAGYDLHLFLLSSRDASLVEPVELEEALSGSPARLVLELHQDELAECLDLVVDYLLSGGEVVNDPRTLFIAHDKRLLSVLCDAGIMRDHVGRDVADVLQHHVIRTWTTGRHTRRAAKSRASRERWVAKRAISGKSDGLVLGSQVSKRRWKATMAEPDFALQHRLDQLPFRAWHPEFRESRTWHLAGTLPIVDGRSYGPGMYRVVATDTCRFYALAQPLLAP